MDVILCSQVIEHLINDVRLLVNIREHLTEGGIACIDSTVDTKKDDYFHGHVHGYPGYSLPYMMIMAGFEVMDTHHVEQTYPDADSDTAVLCVARKPKPIPEVLRLNTMDI